MKLKVGEILAECGTQEAEKACKWFLLWHNRWAQQKYISHWQNTVGGHNNNIFDTGIIGGKTLIYFTLAS